MVGTAWPEFSLWSPRLWQSLSLQAENHAEKLFVVDCDDSRLIGVVLSESRGQRVQKNAALNEVIEENCALSDTVKFTNKHINQPRRKAITEGRQCSRQLKREQSKECSLMVPSMTHLILIN